MQEMFKCFEKHLEQGHYLQIDKWIVRIHDDIRYNVESTLVSAYLTPTAHLFPCGLMTCGCCEDEYEFYGKQNMAYWDDDEEVLVCKDCRLTYNHVLLPMNMFTDDLISEGFQREISYLNMEIDDTRVESYEKRYERMCNVAAQLADSLGGIFLNNMTIEDIRARFLAKRVIRRLREAVDRRRRNNLFRVLYHKANFGLHGALWHAKTVVF
jgi:hypothetical protein